MITLIRDNPLPSDIPVLLTTSGGGFSGMAIPSTPQSEYWVFAVVIILFLFAVIALNRSADWLMITLKGLVKRQNKEAYHFKSTIREYQSRLLLTVFTTGVIVMLIYTHFFTTPPFSMLKFLSLGVVFFVFLMLRNLFAILISYVFMLKDRMRLAREKYYGVYSVLGMILFPLLLLRLYSQSELINEIAGFIAVFVGVVAYVFVVVLIFQIFFKKMLDIFYIMLYLCTLEILPLIGMFQVFKNIIEGV